MLLDLKPFAMSLLIGLVIGIERERRHRVAGSRTMGVRSFALVALLGTLAASTRTPALAATLAASIGILVAVGYWRTTGGASEEAGGHVDRGLTSEFAAAVVFALGYLAHREPLTAGVLGLIVVTVLFSRRFLHGFAKDVLRADEIRAALTLAVFAFVVVPFLPEEPLDPWQILNLRKLGSIIAVIAAIEFFGYAIERYGGPRVGRLATGFFGGLASSTAVFVGLPRQVRDEPRLLRPCLGSGLMATAATLCFLTGILWMASPALAVSAGVPAIVAAAASVGLAFLVTRRREAPEDAKTVERRNPLHMGSALKLGFLLFGLLAVTAVFQRTLGSRAVEVVSFVGGLFELHGITFADATLHASGQLSLDEATIAIYGAVLASFISKIAISWTLGFGKFAIYMTAALMVVLAVLGAAALLSYRFM